MTGALTGSFLGRVTNVRSLSPRALLTQSYRTSAFSKRSLGCDCCADVEERRDKIAKRKTAVILVSTSYLRTPARSESPMCIQTPALPRPQQPQLPSTGAG